MRILTSILIIAIVFAGGLLWGLMYEAELEENHVDNPIEVELIELNDLALDNEREIVQREERVDHPIEKIAQLLERITTSFFEKITNLLYAIVNLLF